MLIFQRLTTRRWYHIKATRWLHQTPWVRTRDRGSRGSHRLSSPSHSLILTFSEWHSHTHSHCHSNFKSHSHTHSLLHSIWHSQSIILSTSHSHSLTITIILSTSHSHSLTITIIVTLSHFHTLTVTLSHSLSRCRKTLAGQLPPNNIDCPAPYDAGIT